MKALIASTLAIAIFSLTSCETSKSGSMPAYEGLTKDMSISQRIQHVRSNSYARIAEAKYRADSTFEARK